MSSTPTSTADQEAAADAVLDLLDDAETAQDDAADTADDTTEDDDGAESTDELGDKGKQALDRMKARLKLEKARRIAAEEAAAQKADGNDADEIRRKAERDATVKANTRIVKAELKAAAAGRLTDPTDALHFIDTSDFEVDDDGNVDEDEIADAIADLLTRKPHLAAQGGPRKPKPDISQGETGAGTATTAQQFAAALDRLI